ncbi:alpha/beta fold hydrolase [Actinomadura rupiterrae]|uniref:alpha/beta fold hydrolase n=1 Tax=Actinomadura rupiterrae TaxID=559627 RepID=UPI0020A3BEB5|nr:alpha/beta hydrolase [Actinomadura rupiterrae]MCP2336778.1 acetyl esterase/lipase [Actinomadura rupiterrae]
MRRVLVGGAAFAAVCVSAASVPGSAGAAPLPTPGSTVGPASPPTLPSPTRPDGTQSATGTPSGSPTGAPSTGPSGPTTPSTTPDADPSANVTGKAVMVTPKLPKTHTFAYGKDARQRVDVYWQPANPKDKKAKPRPGVLLLHGGYWLEGDKSGWKYFARRLTAQGFTVIAPNYRLATTARWPAQRDDSVAALEYVRKHAKSVNLDPKRIAVVGSSAGGLLATQVGTLGEGAERVRGVVALSPVNTPYLAYQDGGNPDATAAQRKLRGAVAKLVGCVPAGPVPGCWDRLDDANAAAHVSRGDAPMLLFHSSRDFVPVTHSTALAGALRVAGVPATVRTVPGAMHGMGLMVDPTVYPALLSWLKARTA